MGVVTKSFFFRRRGESPTARRRSTDSIMAAKRACMVRSSSPTTSAARAAATRELYGTAGQGQVFKFFDTLAPAEQDGLLDQLEKIDVTRLMETYKLTVEAGAGGVAPARPAPLKRVEKLFRASQGDRERWQTRGLSLIGQGSVAYLLLAGGQGTRLGTSDPKGCYDIGLPSRKSLFQLMAERLRRVAEMSKTGGGGEGAEGQSDSVRVPWYVMTSPQTDAATQSFFKKHAFFGLNESDIFFFQQGTLPCLSLDGKILLETKSTVTSAPDGNGGIYVALEKSGALEDMRSRGVEFVHCSSVDNALVLAADPLFVGYCVEQGADCGAKVCAKACAEEAVGVLCAAEGGGARVVEYSELEPSAAKETDPNTGELRLNAGNICNHFYTVDFLQKAAALPTPFHVAKKKVSLAIKFKVAGWRLDR